MIKNKRPKNPVVTVLWRDAAYTFKKKKPKDNPGIHLTTGFTMNVTKKFLDIAVNVEYYKDKGQLYPIDGFVIPQKTIIEFKRIGDYEE